MISIEDFDIQNEITNKTLDSNTDKSQQLSISKTLNESKKNNQDIQNESLSNSYDKRNSIQQQEEIQCLLFNQDATIKKKNNKKQVEFLNIDQTSIKKDNLIILQDSNDCQMNNVYEDIENETSQFIDIENKNNDNNKINYEEKVQRKKIDEIFNKAKNSKNFDSWKYSVYNELFKKSYVIESYINSGGQACVFDGHFLNDKGVKSSCAFKIYFEVSNEEFQKEIDIMKSFENPINVIKVIDSFQIEKCEKSLFDELKQIKEQKVKFSTDKLLQMIFDLLDGLIQFRIYNILHLDIKPGNVLISIDGNYCYSDFGTSFNKKQNEEIQVEQYTKKYAAPEQMENVKSIDYQADVYSLGKTFQVILDIFKKENLSYKDNKHNIREFITDLEEIIKNNMILLISSERLQCQKLHELILQKVIAHIRNSQMIKFYGTYIHKLSNILDLYPYSQNKDIPYFLQMKLFYQKVNMSLNKNINLIKSFKDGLEDLEEFKYQNNINEREFNMYEYLGKNEKKKKYNDMKQKGLTDNCQESFYDMMEQFQNPDTSEDFKRNEVIKLINKFHKTKQMHESLSLSHLGKTYFDAGDYKNALKYSLQALELNKSIYQGNYKDIAFNLTVIGSCYQKLGEYKIGLEYQLESLNMRQQIFIGNNEDIEESLNNVGNSYLNLGDNQTGLAYLLQSLEMRKQIFPIDYSKIAVTLGNIGQVYEYLGDYQNSLNFQLTSLLMFKKVLSGNHPDIGNILGSIGMCFIRIGKIEKGMKYQEKSLKIIKEVFQGDNPTIATSLNSIGVTYMTSNDFVNGLKYSLQSLEMRKQIFQGIHPDIPVSLNNVAQCYIKIGDYINAVKYLQESLQMLKLIYKGNHHPDIPLTLFDLGQCYFQIGDYSNTLKYFQEYIKNGKGKSDINYSLNIIGQCYYNLGDYQNSLKYELESLKINEQKFQGKHPQLAESMYKVGMCYYKLGDFNNSKKYLLTAKDMNKQFIKGFNQYQVDTLQHLSDIYKKSYDFKNSLLYALELLQLLKQYTFKEQDIFVSTVLFNIGFIYIEHGEYKNGLRYILESLDMRQKIFKGEHGSIANNLLQISICFGNLGLVKKQLRYGIKYVEMAKKFNKGANNIIQILINIGNIYINTRDFKKGLKYLFESLQMAKQNFKDNNQLFFSSLAEVISSLSIIQDKIICMKYSFELLGILKQIKQECGSQKSYYINEQIAKTLKFIGQYYFKQGDNELGIQYSSEFIEIFKIIRHPLLADYLYWIGQYCMKTGFYQSGEKYLQESHEMKRNVGDLYKNQSIFP